MTGVPASVLMWTKCDRCGHPRHVHPDGGSCEVRCLCNEFVWPERVNVTTTPAALPFAEVGHCDVSCCDLYPALHVHGDPADYAQYIDRLRQDR